MVRRSPLLAIAVVTAVACTRAPAPATVRAPSAVGQWVWTRTDLARFTESAAARPGLEAAVFVGSIACDRSTHRLSAHARLALSDIADAHATPVIRFEDGLDACRIVGDTAQRFRASLDSAVRILRARGGASAARTVQLDYDVPTRALRAWAASVRDLRAGALRGDTVWVTSIVAQLREPDYGDLFRDVADGHVLQVFDTGEDASAERVAEAVRLATRARMPFRLGLGAFERETVRGVTAHRAWFAEVPRFAVVEGFRGVWVFPAGRRWISLLRERS